MVARPLTSYVCQSCGASFHKWAGRCEACGEWNNLVEEVSGPPVGGRPLGGKPLARGGARHKIEFVELRGVSEPAPRRSTGIQELDRVTGGGLVPGSALLIGGDPGIGKSTLLIQATARLAMDGARCAYISGEEAIDQVRMRAARLGIADAPVELATATSLRDIAGALEAGRGPDVAVIDSIQTIYSDALDSAPGTVSQVRACAQELIRLAKKRGFALLIVGHVTKEGLIAGPRVLEHMVDTVLYFEGERGHQFRILRAVKNRFGPTDEIGVFEMTDAGLAEVPNPSALFLGERQSSGSETGGAEGEDTPDAFASGQVSGAAVFAGIEGTRPVLVEVQALVAPAVLGTPRRAVGGWDGTRLAMITAVLDARCGLSVGANDIYLNIAGGLRIAEPAADLAVAAALLSALSETPVPGDTVVFGEIALSGEVRPVGHSEARLKEAAKLGFAEAWMPRRSRRKRSDDGLATIGIAHLGDLVARLSPKRAPLR